MFSAFRFLMGEQQRYVKVRRSYFFRDFIYHRWYMVPASPPQQEARPAVPPTYELPFIVTQCQGGRPWEDIDRVIGRINQALSPARIKFGVSEEFQGEVSVKVEECAFRCPFENHLDHGFEWMHLAFVEKLPDDNPVLCGCGRCGLIPNLCDDRSIVKTVGHLLGIRDNPDPTATSQLMSRGTGYDLTELEISWMRYNAKRMLGEKIRPNITEIPVFVHSVGSPDVLRSSRSENEVRQILEKVNEVWYGGGLQFVFRGFSRIEEAQMGVPQWNETLNRDLRETPHLAKLAAGAPSAAHLVLANFPSEKPRRDVDRFIVLMPDALKVGRTRAVAQAFGACLGLTAVAGEDQLMSFAGEGFRLSLLEEAFARAGARKRLARAPRPAAPAAPKVPGTPLAKPTSLPGLIPPPAKMPFVAPAPVPPAQGQAPAKAAAPPAAAAAAPSPAKPAAQPTAQPAAPGLKPLTIPVKLHLVHGRSKMTPDQAKALLAKVNEIWAQAAVRWELNSVTMVDIPPKALEDTYPTHSQHTDPKRKQNYSGLARAGCYHPNSLNIFYVDTIPYVGKDLNSEYQHSLPHRIVVAPEKFYKHAPERCLARAFAGFLGVKVTVKEREGLTNMSSPSTALTPTEIEEARKQADKLLTVLPSGKAPAGLREIGVPLRIHLVRNARYGTKITPQQAKQMVEPLVEVWVNAGIRLLFGVILEFSMEDKQLEPAFAEDPEGKTRKKDCSGLLTVAAYSKSAVNLYIMGKVGYKGDFLTSCDRATHTIMVADNVSLRALARGVGMFFNTGPNPYELPQRLMGTGDGLELGSVDVERARKQAEQLFKT